MFAVLIRVTNVAKPQLKCNGSILLSAIIHITFGNEVSLTPKLSSWLKKRHAYCFSKRVLFSIFPFSFELQKVYLNRNKQENAIESFKASRLNLTGLSAEVKLHTSCHRYTAVRTYRFFTMVAPQETGRTCARAML